MMDGGRTVDGSGETNDGEPKSKPTAVVVLYPDAGFGTRTGES